MKRVFYSFHYKNDCRRVSQVKQIGAIDGQKIVTSNEWENVERGGDAAIKRWIDDGMHGRSTLVVLIGEHTANRKWVNYEIRKAWDEGKGVVGIYIHNLKCPVNGTSRKGKNPFDFISLTSGKKLSDYVECYDPSAYDAYNDIANNLEKLVDRAAKR